STRSGPNFCCSPTVARKTPPFTPTSSPSTQTLSSCAISHASARLTASTRLISAKLSLSPALPQRGGRRRGGTLRFERRRQRRVQVLEHVLGLGRGRRFVRGDLLGDFLGALVLQPLLALLVPHALLREIFAQPHDRLSPPRGVP